MRKNDYLLFIRGLPCFICEDIAEVHHIRAGRVIPYDYHGGAGKKPSDYMCVPLCREHHQECERSYSNFEKEYHVDLGKEIIKCLVKYIEREK